MLFRSRIGQSKQILVAMAADPDLPVGMKKSYSGVLHGRSVEANPTENGAWVMDIAIPGAFDDSGDFCGEVASESEVIALIRQFADTERIPDALSPAEEFRFRDNPHD